MIDYKKELRYFKNVDGSHIRCEIDLAPTGIDTTALDIGIVMSHDILFSHYMIPLELCNIGLKTVDLSILLPSLNNFAKDQPSWKKIECSLRSIFSSLSNLSNLEDLHISIDVDGRNGDIEKKRRLLPNITKHMCLGGLFLPHASTIVMNFPSIPGTAFSFEFINAPNLGRIETNFAAPCTEKTCLLFNREHGKPLMNQCFGSFQEDSNDQFAIQGFHFDREIIGGCGLQYELEEEHCDGGLFSISKIHFKEITGCGLLERINVRCGNKYPRGNEYRMMQPGW